jgi:cell wall-associated NlpC family hydrolase
MRAREFFIILTSTAVLTAQEPKTPEKPTEPEKAEPKPAAVSTLETTDLTDFEKQPERVQKLINAALALTKKNLTYLYASHDPARGGMDCSGSVYRVLVDEKVASLDTIPRSSDLMCEWTMNSGTFHRTETAKSVDAEVFKALQPGDLLFWARHEGTEPGRKLPITHVMIYLGKRVKDGRHVIYGSSDGRSYEGQKRCGVSVFDFSLPKPDAKIVFYGYGAVPEVKKAVPEKSK